MTILVVETQAQYVWNFRREIIQALISQGDKVIVATLDDGYQDKLKDIGCETLTLTFNQHGLNPLADFFLVFKLLGIIKEKDPDTILTYTTKPNIYASLAAQITRTPYLVNITGMGTALTHEGLVQNLMLLMYRVAFAKAKVVFFQNKMNKQFFLDMRLVKGKYVMLPGSGVNLDRFSLLEYPKSEKIEFAFISRVIKEKGIDLYLQVAERLKDQCVFHICGSCTDEYRELIIKKNQNGIIVYHGNIANVHAFLTNIHCVIHPSYYPEGISNVLLESMASARPIITTENVGCCECVREGKNGYIIPIKNVDALYNSVLKFLALSYFERRSMGLAGRMIAENRFDRNVIVRDYVRVINALK
ncbi:glycosyl transferase [Clostridia bacterium]|nr:glycosyl transferase [Clostridia bacterium]